MQPILSAEQYAIERAICDKAEEYARATMAKRGKRCNYLTADEAAHPDYAACNNDMRGRVEQYEILTEMPETIVGYIVGDKVTVWTGCEIGTARITSSWRTPRSFVSSHMYQYHCRIGRVGAVYTGRCGGSGVAIVLRYSTKLDAKR